jgi:formylglycine-generating enzyme required for sulfatase activity
MSADELKRIQAAIAAQEGLLGTGVLPDEQIQATLAALREKEASLLTPNPASGTSARGDGAVAASAAGVAVGCDVADSFLNTGSIHGDVNIGSKRPGEISEAELRLAYLAWVRNECAYLKLSGVDPGMGGKEDTRLDLNAVYTALLTLATQERDQARPGYLRDDDGVQDRQSALEQINRHPRLVLQGDPGSGKSTFVSFVALCLAGEGLAAGQANLARLTQPLPDDQGEDGKEPQPWDHGPLLPVVVVLRDFAATGLPPAGEPASAEDLWAFEDYGPVLRSHLRKHGALVLLDGLDEVPEAEQRREQVRQAVEDFAGVYHRCRLLVTSRTYAYQNQDWRLQGFAEAVLAPLSDGQIRRFIDRWYAHAAALGRLDAEDAQGRAALLRDAVFRRGRLLGLARRPLLLTLIASLHAWRGGNLPEKRERLYADTVELLLDFWEQRRLRRDAAGGLRRDAAGNPVVLQPSIVEWLQADRDRVRGVLEALACEAHAAQPEVTGTADISEDRLVGLLLRLGGSGNPAELVRYLRERAGILVPHGVGVYTFPHRSFQEYLAACRLTGDRFPDEIAGLARQDPDRWREVALLAGAKAARGAGATVWQLAEALCYRDLPQAGQAAAEDLWGAQMAGQLLAETADLVQVSEPNRAKLERIRGWLLRIMRGDALPATERAIAGDSLARLGDPRFDPAHWSLPKEPLLGFLPVPAGKFLMGSDDSMDSLFASAKPRHHVSLPDFHIARWPVTVDQFGAFLDVTGYAQADPRCRQGIGNHPVVYVTWRDALGYCGWLGERLREHACQRASRLGADDPNWDFWQALAEGRLRAGLPSEAEWERAARHTDGRCYPWGDHADPERANYADTGIGATSAVGCFPAGASAIGCEDMSGNVWEWTRTLWGNDWKEPTYAYPYVHDDGREDLAAPDSDRRLLRGGAFVSYGNVVRCAYRLHYEPVPRYLDVGFRVVLSPLL